MFSTLCRTLAGQQKLMSPQTTGRLSVTRNCATMLGVVPRYSRKAEAVGEPSEPENVELAPCPPVDEFSFDRDIAVDRRRSFRGGRGRGGPFRGGFRGRGGNGLQQQQPLARGWTQGSAAVRPSHEGGWKCPCGAANFKGRKDCFKCKSPMPPGVAIIGAAGSAPPQGPAPLPWSCECGIQNTGTRDTCYGCFLPKKK